MLAQDRLQNIRIYENTSKVAKWGYKNCDMNRNGERRIASMAIRSGDVVFDIGAAIGDWSQMVLDYNKNVSLYAFEPIPETFASLQERLNLPNVRLYNLAFSQHVGGADFFVYCASDGVMERSSLYYRPVIADSFKQKIQVPTQNLDCFCKENQIARIDFLKMDTEGAEPFILLGAQDLLNRKAISVIQLEYGGCNIDSKTTLKQIYKLLKSKGYSIYRIVPKGLVEVRSWDPKLENFKYSNYLAVLKD